jgi:hypothetical protein
MLAALPPTTEFPLAFAAVPTAVLLEAVPVALALGPQATFVPPAAVAAPPSAAPPSAVAGGTVAPAALPTQTNCACAAGVPSTSTIASAVPTDATKDNRTLFITAHPTGEEKFSDNSYNVRERYRIRRGQIPVKLFDIFVARGAPDTQI